MFQSDMQKLCNIVNSGMYIRSFLWENEYSRENSDVQDNLTITFDPQIDFSSEKVLKVKCYAIQNLICENVFHCISRPTIQIEDMSVRGYESCSYFVKEIEDMFYFYCSDIEYYWENLQDCI